MNTQNNITPITTTKVEFFVPAKFPALNKQDQWNDYLTQMDETQTRKVQVTEIITLSAMDFEFFKNGLLDDQTWLDGKGGTNSTFKLGREINEIWEMTEQELTQWRNEAFNIVVMVQNEFGDNILVDPQGYKYARYCGMIATK
jgi:hypothetical protein